MALTNTVLSANEKIMSSLSTIHWATIFGWIVFILLLAGGGIWAYIYYTNKRSFSKRITAFEIVSGEWKPCIRDFAKIIKLGRGGFEILYLQKLKTWKIAYGGRIGKNDYYFFIMPDGYWYNGSLMANINRIDEAGGLIPITTTNPLMRGQYTALEKQINDLTSVKKGVWEQYGTWIMGMSFMLIIGVLSWLMFKEWRGTISQVGGMMKGNGIITDKLATLANNIKQLSCGASKTISNTASGLVHV